MTDLVLPDPVPSPTITIPNPAWKSAVADVELQLINACGEADLDCPGSESHYVQAVRLLADRLLGQGDQ